MKLFYSLLFVMGTAGIAVAQRLPDTQKASLTIPKSIRIDGKLLEWPDGLQADNGRLALNYSLANDDKNLYLAIRSTDEQTINKILAGGISLLINPEGKRDENKSVTITYPIVKRTGRGSGGGGRMRGQFGGGSRDNADKSAQDSINLVRRKEVIAGAKEIAMQNVTGIPDSLLSIYNEYGVKVRMAITTDELIYELMVPLKHLALDANITELTYQIRLNGVSGNFGSGGRQGGQRAMGGGSDLYSPTYFWAKYPVWKP